MPPNARTSGTALKVMLSSVRRGLANVRGTVAPSSDPRYDRIRFEDVTGHPVPPPAVGVQMVDNSDIYVLILGEHYGDPMPGPGLAPTEEDWSGPLPR